MITKFINENESYVIARPSFNRSWNQESVESTLDELAQDISDVNEHARDAEKEMQMVDELDDIADVTVDIDLNIDTTEVKVEYEFKSNNRCYDNIVDALADEINLDVPGDGQYFYSYNNVAYNNSTYSSSASTFRELIEIAYMNPMEFECKGLTPEEQDFLNGVLAYKVQEKLMK